MQQGEAAVRGPPHDHPACVDDRQGTASEALGVVVFQSEWFRDQQLPEIDEMETEELGIARWTPRENELAQSLRTMREAMIGSMECSGALFIGGMEGIHEEHTLLKQLRPNTPCFPVAGPGGAAACLSGNDWESLGLPELYQSRAYPLVALRLMDALANQRIPPQ